jgi:hypothetical protein
VAYDFNDEDFWDGEEEEGYFDENRFPRVWLLSMGILSVILVVGVVALTFRALFRPAPTPRPVLSPVEGPVLSPVEGPVLSPVEGPVLSPVEGPALSPVEGPVLSPTEGMSTPITVQGTSAPPPSAPTSVPAAPAGIAIGIYVKVSNTGGNDLSFRAGPSANHARLKIVAEGSMLKVLDGPVEADGYVWWQSQDVSDGVVGWAVADYLEPTAP